MKGGRTISVHKNNCKMAPFRDQFFDLVDDKGTPNQIDQFNNLEQLKRSNTRHMKAPSGLRGGSYVPQSEHTTQTG